MTTLASLLAALLLFLLAATALVLFIARRNIRDLLWAVSWGLIGMLALQPGAGTAAWRAAILAVAAACFAPGLYALARDAARAGGWRTDELELLLEEDPNMICVVQEDTVAFANRALRERSGRTMDQLRNKPPIRFLPAGDRRQAVETDFRDRLGNEVPVLVHAQPLEWRGSPAWRYELIDISEQRGAEREVREMMKELQRMNAELEASNRMQAEFLSNTTHELKTPLTSIIANTEVLEYEMCGPVNEEQRRVLTNISRNSQHLLRMISRLLAFASQREGRDELKLQEVSVRMLLENVVETVRPMLEEGALQVELDVDEDMDPCSMDPEKIYRVYLNLVENAIKFSPGGVIRASARMVDGELEGSVTDQGVGIPPDMLEEVFRPFRQADASPTRTYGGVGLGLAICRHLVELHGGRIWAESEAGGGTTIRFRLPCDGRGGEPAARGAPTPE